MRQISYLAGKESSFVKVKYKGRNPYFSFSVNEIQGASFSYFLQNKRN